MINGGTTLCRVYHEGGFYFKFFDWGGGKFNDFFVTSVFPAVFPV